MYFEIHGAGEPLVLLHGGVGAIEMFGEVLPLLAAPAKEKQHDKRNFERRHQPIATYHQPHRRI
jgi:hypothetical protein